MTIPSQPNPYVGLRPFFDRDSRTFFGRDQQISELQEILHRTRFLPIVGGSGSGKSSLVRAGLIPRIGAGFLVGDRDHWTTVICRPGDAPINNLATALAEAMGAPEAVGGEEGLEASMRISLAGGARDFILARLGARSSLLILVDQFEELFAFRGASSDDEQLPSEAREHLARRRAEAADYVDLLLGLAETTEAPVFVVLTMRSDFLGDCDMFHGLPEAMNNARYLVPRLSREQMRQAVEGPALMVGAHMTARLVDRLINALGDRADRLPVLQHALQRTYDDWATRGGAGPIDIEHFEAAGGLEHALDKDAEAALATVDAVLAERVFRALTDTDVSLRRVRRPCRVRALVAATEADRAPVDAVIAAFRTHERNFLYLARDGEPDNPRVDISHESLIRQWPRLAGWVDAERRARDTYLRILASARSQAAGERELMLEREFTVQKGLWDAIRATAAWAERYARASDDFAVAARFVEESRVAVEQERQERRARELHDAMELARKRRARKRFWIGTGVVGAGVLAVILMLLVVANRSLDEAARANRLAAIRDYAVSDPTMAAALLRDLDQAQEFQWSDIAAMRTVAGAPLARLLEDSVADVQVSRTPNSARLVMLKHDGSLLVWDRFDSAARVIRSGAAHGSQVTVDAAMTLAVVSDTIGGRLHLVHLTGDPQPRTLGDSIPDRRIPRMSADGRVVLATCQTGFCLFSTVGPTAEVDTLHLDDKCEPTGLDLSSDGTRALVSCWEGSVWLWARQPGAPGMLATSLRLGAHRGRVMVAARLSRNGRYAAAGSLDGGTLFLWSVDRPDVPLRVDSLLAGIVELRFNDAGTRLAAATTAGVAVLDVDAARAPPRWYREHAGEVSSVRWSRDGTKLVSASLDNTAHVWAVNDATATDACPDSVRFRSVSGRCPVAHLELKGHAAAVSRGAFTADGQDVVTASDDGTARVWNVTQDPEPLVVTVTTGSGDAVRRARLSGDTLLTVVTRKEIRLYRLQYDERRHAFLLRDSGVVVTVPPAGGVDGALRVQDARFVRDTLWAVATLGRTTTLHRRAPGRVMEAVGAFEWGRGVDSTRGYRIDSTGRAVSFVHVSIDGVIPYGRPSIAAALWRLGGGAVIQRQADATSEIGSLADRPPVTGDVAGDRFAANSRAERNENAVVWSARDGRARYTLADAKGWAIGFGPAGRVAAELRNNQVATYRLTDSLHTAKRPGVIAADSILLGARQQLLSLVYSQSGTMLAAGDTAGVINLWAPGIPKRYGLMLLTGHAGAAGSIEFSDDDDHVLTGSRDGTVRIWTISAEALITRIRSYSSVCVPRSVRMERLSESGRAAATRYQACRTGQVGAAAK